MASVGQIYYNVLDAINQDDPSYEGNLISNISAAEFYGDSGDIVSHQGATQLNKLGIQAPPGTQVVLNTKTIMVGRTGIYELDDDIAITSMYFVKPKNYTEDAEAIYKAIKESTADMRQAEIDKDNAMESFYQNYGRTPPSQDTDPDGYEAYYNAYTAIQNSFITTYDEALNKYNQGINGIYILDPDTPYQDLYNVIVDFIYE